MTSATHIDTPGALPAEPDVSECYARTVEPAYPSVRAASNEDLAGPLVDGLLALGVADHIVTPCQNGLVRRFEAGARGRVRLVWSIAVGARETDEASEDPFDGATEPVTKHLRAI